MVSHRDAAWHDFLPHHRSGADGTEFSLDDLAEVGVLHRIMKDYCEIPGAGIMIRRRESMRVGKMAVGCAEVMSSFGHQLTETFHRTGHSFSQHHARIVG